MSESEESENREKAYDTISKDEKQNRPIHKAKRTERKCLKEMVENKATKEKDEETSEDEIEQVDVSQLPQFVINFGLRVLNGCSRALGLIKNLFFYFCKSVFNALPSTLFLVFIYLFDSIFYVEESKLEDKFRYITEAHVWTPVPLLASCFSSCGIPVNKRKKFDRNSLDFSLIFFLNSLISTFVLPDQYVHWIRSAIFGCFAFRQVFSIP
ncbi:DgyrCDS5662 [Dimorphilus gyrociliatus]|uniref:DgyrCDS5662 n=1 Tax=Dimorphilus gyrociliatus TaxID=2664684 RepID=A0A7I8VM75_9ANNE|nr:DgyrCDS5662 [Dimorphilus gyrociliatus]